MKWKKTLLAVGMVTTLSFGVVGCSSGEAYSPQEVIDQALQEMKEVSSYYGEYTMDFGDEEGKATVKEWVKNGKRRIEMLSDNGEKVITVNDNKQITMLNMKENQAMIFPITEEDLEGISGRSPKDQAKQMLDLVKDSHDISIAGEEKVAGRDTYHIIAKNKGKDTLFGDMEVWIDKETWVILKTKTVSAGNVMTTEYQKIDFDQDIDDAKFTLEIPDGMAVEEFDKEDFSAAPSTMEEAKEKLGKFLIVPETNGLKITKVEDLKVEDTGEHSFEYAKDNVPAFSLSVFKPKDSDAEMAALPTETNIEIRGNKGMKMEEGDFRLLSWNEDGYQYSILIMDPEISFEEMLRYAETMTLVQ